MGQIYECVGLRGSPQAAVWPFPRFFEIRFKIKWLERKYISIETLIEIKCISTE